MDQQQHRDISNLFNDDGEDDFQTRGQLAQSVGGVHADENCPNGFLYDASRRTSFVSIPSVVSSVAAVSDGAYHSVDFSVVSGDGSILNGDDCYTNTNERRNLLGGDQVTYRRQPRTICYRFIHIIDIFLSIVLFSPIVSIFW